MSLFLRLWIIGTLIALAAAGIAVIANEVVREQQVEAHAEIQAKTLGRVVSHVMSMEPLSDLSGGEATALLERRALELVATGRLLSVTLVGRDLSPLVLEAVPGLEEEETLARLGDEVFVGALARGATTAVTVDHTVHVVGPLVDGGGEFRGALAIAVPVDLLDIDSSTGIVFASLAAALAVLLGLIAALVLTDQVARPIGRLAKVADRLESGHFDTAAVTTLIGRRDEIGRLARVMLRLVQALDHLGQQMDSVVESRLRERAAQAEKDEESKP